MYIEMNPTGLTLSDLICVAHRKRSEDTGFPYAVQSCRCSNCRYVSEGKCSLKECCCMAERVKAHTCTFAEILNTCFANVKDNVFHYRLRLAAERATMAKTCFLDREHRARFQKALHRVRGNDKSLIAQLFVLTATESLWSASDATIGKSRISYLDIDFRAFSENDYLFYCIAYDLGNGTSHTDIEDLSNDEVVDFDLFRVVCSAIAISVYGYDIDHFREVEENLERVLDELSLQHPYMDFYVGNDGDFDRIATSVIRRLIDRRGRENFTINLVLPYPKANMDLLEKQFDSVMIPPTLHSVHPKAAITERNRWMVENCDLLIAHLVHERGGAWTAIRMAEKTKKTIVKI